jgi:hypothetical protein
MDPKNNILFYVVQQLQTQDNVLDTRVMTPEEEKEPLNFEE